MTIEIFLALFIFILMVLVSIEDAATGFLLLLMLIPLQHKELFSLVIWDVLPVRIAFFGLLLTTFYRFYLWYRRYKKRDIVVKFIRDPILILLSLLFIIRLFSLSYAVDPVYGVKLLAFYSTIIYLYVLLKYLFLAKGFSFIEKGLFVYGVLAAVTGVVALIQFYSFKLFAIKFGAIWDIPGHNPRVGSTFWDVNHYGAFVMSVIPISLAFSMFKSKTQRIFWIINTLFLMYILFITQSRSAWLGFAFAALVFIVYLFLKGFNKYLRYILFTLLVIFAGAFLYVEISGTNVVKVYKNFMHTRLDSFDTHFILVRGAYEAYSNKPFFGAGYGNFNEAFRATSYSDEYFFREKNIVNQRVPSHSIWGEVIAETGFVGLVSYSLLFIITLVYLTRGYFISQDKKSILAVALISSISSLLVSGIFYTYNLEFFWLTLFFASSLGVYLNPDLSFDKFFSYLFKQKYLPLIVLSIYSFFALFWDLAKNKLIDWDEAIYAEISKNIVKTGDLLTMQWTIGSPWFEKPPFYMWFSSLTMRIFGFTELGARIPSAFFGLLTVILVYFTGVKLFKSRFIGFLAGIVLITTADFWYYSRLGMLDVTVTFFILATIYFFYLFIETNSTKNALLSGLFFGLGVLTKSVVGLLPLPILFTYIVYLLFFNKNFMPKKYAKGFLIFLITFVLIAVPWHIYMYLTYGYDFIKIYFFEHIFGRGLSDVQGKTQPFGFYIERFRPSMRVWYLALVPSILIYLVHLFKNIKSHILVFISAIFIFVFFSISKSKLIWYIIPIYPYLALIIAYSVYETIFIFDKYIQKYIQKFKPLSMLKELFIYKNLIGITAFTVFFGVFLYIVNVQKLVFVGDFNADRVRVIEAYNENYASDPASNIKALYYLRIQTPVVKFYTLGDSIPSDTDPFSNTIEEASFTTPLTYISRGGEVKYFQDKYGNDKVVQSYNAGAYYLMYVRSGEETALKKAEALNIKIRGLISEYNVEEDAGKRFQILNSINENQQKVYDQQKILNANMPQKYLEPRYLFYSPKTTLVFGIY